MLLLGTSAAINSFMGQNQPSPSPPLRSSLASYKVGLSPPPKPPHKQGERERFMALPYKPFCGKSDCGLVLCSSLANSTRNLSKHYVQSCVMGVIVKRDGEGKLVTTCHTIASTVINPSSPLPFLPRWARQHILNRFARDLTRLWP